MSILAIYNPVSGDGSATQFFNDHVLPLLNQHGKQPLHISQTTHAGHAGQLVNSFISTHPGPATVIIGSGDGTVHEIVNGISDISAPTPIDLVIVPLGTANALYSSLFPPSAEIEDPTAYRLQGLTAFINGSSPRPLTLTKTAIDSETPVTVYSAVVTSTALHASILHDSEALRKEMPGIERFKVAAQHNITRWYNGSVTLYPITPDGAVQVYDPESGALVPYAKEKDKPITLQGPFAYFLSTVNVDRLEPAFRITPMVSSVPPTTASLDVVIIRPLRDPLVTSDSDEQRAAFAQTAGHILGEAYKDGHHINVRWGSISQSIPQSDAETVVEYFRCGGFEWVPEEADDRAHLLCADGAIFQISKSGRAVSSATPQTDNGIRFSVYA